MSFKWRTISKTISSAWQHIDLQGSAAKARRSIEQARATSTSTVSLSLQSTIELCQGVRAVEEALLRSDETMMDPVLDDFVTLHGDGILHKKDIHNFGPVRDYFKGYVDSYDPRHEPLDVAASDQEPVAFSFSIDEVLAPKFTGSIDDVQASRPCIITALDDSMQVLPVRRHDPLDMETVERYDAQRCHVAAIRKHDFNKLGKISAIHVAREPTPDERKRLGLQGQPARYNLNWLERQCVYLEGAVADTARNQQVGEVAKRYALMWATGRMAGDDALFLHPTMQSIDLLRGLTFNGRSEIESLLAFPIEGESDAVVTSQDTAVTTDGRKAFVHWTAKLENASLHGDNTLEGYHFLKIDDDLPQVYIDFHWRTLTLRDPNVLVMHEPPIAMQF